MKSLKELRATLMLVLLVLLSVYSSAHAALDSDGSSSQWVDEDMEICDSGNPSAATNFSAPMLDNLFSDNLSNKQPLILTACNISVACDEGCDLKWKVCTLGADTTRVQQCRKNLDACFKQCDLAWCNN